MIVDSSAILAILFDEPMGSRILAVFDRAPSISVGAPTAVEAGIVAGSRLGFGIRAVNQLLTHLEATIVPCTALHAEEALRAFEKFGKGRHKAALNYGDCLAYAVARLAQEPLVCVGDDFRHTDLLLQEF